MKRIRKEIVCYLNDVIELKNVFYVGDYIGINHFQ